MVIAFILVIILGSVFLASYPLYPRITGNLTVQFAEPRFSLTYLAQDRRTIFQASGSQKNLIGLTLISPAQQSGTFGLSITVTDSNGKSVAQASWENIPIGLYSFTVVLDAQLPTNVSYHLSMIAQFQGNVNVVIEANTPPF